MYYLYLIIRIGLVIDYFYLAFDHFWSSEILEHWSSRALELTGQHWAEGTFLEALELWPVCQMRINLLMCTL